MLKHSVCLRLHLIKYCTYRFEISMKLTLTSHSVEKNFRSLQTVLNDQMSKNYKKYQNLWIQPMKVAERGRKNECKFLMHGRDRPMILICTAPGDPFTTILTLTVLNFWKFTCYCSLKPLWSGMGEVVPARTSLTLHPPSPPAHQLSRLAL